MNRILVTGGAGFIGSCFIRRRLSDHQSHIANIDALTYAGNLNSIPSTPEDRYRFIHGDISDDQLVTSSIQAFSPNVIVNFAAETHVDRSIQDADDFVQTNIVGVANLLKASLDFYQSLSRDDRESFRFVQVSTDEVFGSLGESGAFNESSNFAPNSPYAASKASGEMLVRSFHSTYGLPTLTTICSNNFGPYQFPEKLIPLMTLNALANQPLPVYGDGSNVRDWIFVDHHCQAIDTIIEKGQPGESYCIGGNHERSNLDVVKAICAIVDEKCGRPPGSSEKLIEFVQDRPGHDQRYAIDASKLKTELGWAPSSDFDEHMAETIQWYIDHDGWVQEMLSRSGYRKERLGLPREKL